MQTSRTPRRYVRVTSALLAALLVGTAASAVAALPTGIDTSHYQHAPSLNWASVKASGAKFAYLKATESTTFRDPYFAADWAATANNGIYHGAYHFARPSIGSAPAQARYFASVIGPQRGRGTLPPVLDLEASGGLSASQLIAWTRSWLTTVAGLTGRTPMIYVSPSFWQDHLANSTAFHAYPLWVANYGVSQPRVPGGWPTWSFWQSTSSARVTGISGNVDKDVFNGSLTQLQKMALAFTPSATVLTLATNNAAPMTGQTFTLSGTLRTAAGAPLAGRTVALQGQDPGATTWTRTATATTTSTGAYAVRTTVTAARRFQTTFAGSTALRPASSAVVPVALTPRPTSLALSTSKAQGLAGTPLTLSGSLLVTPGTPLAGQPVTISQRVSGSTVWRPVATSTSAANGTWKVVTTLRGTGSFRATFAGAPAYSRAASAPRPVTVTRNPSAVTLAVSNSRFYGGQSVGLSGTLTSGATLVRGAPVTISRKPAGSTTWRVLGTTTTDSHGHFATRSVVDRTAAYRADYLGDWRFVASTSTSRGVTLTPPTPTTLTMSAPSSATRTLGLGRPVVLSGRLTTGAGVPVPHRAIWLWKHTAAVDHWYRVAGNVTLDPSGAWHVSVQPRATSWFQATFVGASRYRSSNSPRLRITIG